MNIFPQCQLDDSFAHLVILDERSGRISSLKMLLEIENNAFFKKIENESDEEAISYRENDGFSFDYHKITEFTLEPDAEFVRRAHDPAENISYGQITVDGEGFKPENLTCKILPLALEVFW
mmetsp:Transcript_23296/g.20672  ORF Transcript_23296/g.20672 Transcript_23296/m.20672 type:complete len:121 (-) Transcript_23296:75-437(-)